jgi:hypothetical protein
MRFALLEKFIAIAGVPLPPFLTPKNGCQTSLNARGVARLRIRVHVYSLSSLSPQRLLKHLYVLGVTELEIGIMWPFCGV